MKRLKLSYLDSDNEENEIDEPINLQNAYRYGQKRMSRKVLKIRVRVNQQPNDDV